MSDQSDEQQIHHIINTWLKASAEDDLDTVLSLMAEDVVFLRPGMPPMQGRDAYAAASRSMQGKLRIHGHPDIREIEIAGDRAFVWNYLSITATPLPHGPPITSEGHILSVFRREPDGRWVLYRDANLLTRVSPEPNA